MFLAGMRLAATRFFFESYSPAVVGRLQRRTQNYFAGTVLTTIELAV
jgi:hypothetical protein